MSGLVPCGGTTLLRIKFLEPYLTALDSLSVFCFGELDDSHKQYLTLHRGYSRDSKTVWLHSGKDVESAIGSCIRLSWLVNKA